MNYDFHVVSYSEHGIISRSNGFALDEFDSNSGRFAVEFHAKNQLRWDFEDDSPVYGKSFVLSFYDEVGPFAYANHLLRMLPLLRFWLGGVGPKLSTLDLIETEYWLDFAENELLRITLSNMAEVLWGEPIDDLSPTLDGLMEVVPEEHPGQIVLGDGLKVCDTHIPFPSFSELGALPHSGGAYSRDKMSCELEPDIRQVLGEIPRNSPTPDLVKDPANDQGTRFQVIEKWLATISVTEDFLSYSDDHSLMGSDDGLSQDKPLLEVIASGVG